MKETSILALALALVAPAAAPAVEREGLAIWVEPSTRKVFADAPPGSTREIDLAAARGEWESAQIVLRAPKAWSVTISSWPGLKGPEGAEIPAAAIELRRIAYVPVPYAKKSWPDPLVPLKGPVELKAGEDVPILVTVRVPREAKPGVYRSAIVVVSMDPGGEVEGSIPPITRTSIPIALRVWPFAIPERPSVKTAFGISLDMALKFEGIAAGTPEARAMGERYWRILVDHRISPYEIPCDILDPEAGKFLDDPGLTTFTIPYRDDAAWVKARVDRCREKGWLDRAYFYPWDEPVTDEQYASLRKGVEKIRSIDPKLRIVSPFFRDSAAGKPAYDALDGLVTIWCSVSAYFNPARMEEKRKKGEEVWWYVCCGPGSPYANLHLTMDAADHRVLPWQMYRNRIEGFLYWSTTYWNPAFLKSPWLDQVTVPDINKELSGDGSLLYPGKLPSGERAAEGPVASLRLLNLRDGFEDLEYLVLLEKAEGREAAGRAAAGISPELTKFSKDPAEYERVRREIAGRIAK
jgi:hypothetical protein